MVADRSCSALATRAASASARLTASSRVMISRVCAAVGAVRSASRRAAMSSGLSRTVLARVPPSTRSRAFTALAAAVASTPPVLALVTSGTASARGCGLPRWIVDCLDAAALALPRLRSVPLTLPLSVGVVGGGAISAVSLSRRACTCAGSCRSPALRYGLSFFTNAVPILAHSSSVRAPSQSA